MKKSYIIGVDVSKLKLDLHCYGQPNSFVISNDSKGFKAILKWIKKEVNKDFSNVMVVMEYTGIYTYGLEQFLHQQGIKYVKRPALDIKRSVGMKRGKTDKADARMISRLVSPGRVKANETCKRSSAAVAAAYELPG